MRPILVATLLMLASVALAGPLKLQTADGVALHAVESGRGAHAVLLLHDHGRTSADWRLFADKLEDKGYRVLSLDLRGHGESASILDATEPDWAAMRADVDAALAHLRKRGARQISIVGAGLGANLAVEAASADPSITSLVLLSPGLNIKGYKPSKPLAAYGARPVLFAAAEDDRMASSTVTYLSKQAAGPHRSVLLKGEKSGTNLIDDNPGLEDGVLGWLAGNYDAMAGPEGAKALTTGDVGTMESSGKKYGDE
jgi:pimeloyl-ACP methyl ester carboxylesterase